MHAESVWLLSHVFWFETIFSEDCQGDGSHGGHTSSHDSCPAHLLVDSTAELHELNK